MANEITYRILADARQYVQEMRVAERSGEALEQQNDELEKAGVRTTAAFRKEIETLDRLTKEYQQDTLAVTQLTRKKEALVAEMKKVESGAKAQTNAMGGLGTGVGALKAAYGALIASGVTQFLLDAARAGIEQQKALARVESSVVAARREFGEAIGTTEAWQDTMADLEHQFGFTETAIASATARTVDMTKRLGLNQVQMQVVLDRSAALAAGKTDLEGAVERVSAALRGEAESAEFLGLTLNQDFIKQQALARGLEKDLIPKLTQTELAQLRLLEVMQQSQGAYDTLDVIQGTQAVQVERLIAKWENLKGTIGITTLGLLESAGVFDLVSGKISAGEIILRTYVSTLSGLGPLLGLIGVRAKETADGVDEATRAFDTFVRDISAVSTEVAQGITREAFDAAREAGTLVEFRRQVFESASQALIRQIRTEARERADAGGKAVSLYQQQAEAAGKLRSTLAQLTGPEGARLADLQLQAAALEAQVKHAVTLNRLRAEDRAAQALRARAGAPPQGRLAPRGMDEIDTATIRDVPFLQAEELGGGLGFVRERLTDVQAAAAGIGVELRGIPSGIAAAYEQIKPVSDQIAEALTDPFDRAGLSVEAWVTRTTQGAAFAGAVLGESLQGFANLAESIYDAAGEKALGWFKLAKGISIASAIASTWGAANKALETGGPVPLNYIAMAGVIAQGLANVARIIATEPGSTSGGSTGSSGPALASPGTTGITPTQPGGIAAGNLDFIRGASLQDAVQAQLSMAMDPVVQAIDDLDISTTLKDDHVLIQVGRASKMEKSVGL